MKVTDGHVSPWVTFKDNFSYFKPVIGQNLEYAARLTFYM